MKKTNYIAILGHAFMALAVVGAITSCVDDAESIDIFHASKGDGLTVQPIVSEATLVTRAPSIEELMEKQLNTLDVFVEAVDNAGTIMKQYHLVASSTTPIQEAVNNWLADNWRAEGLVVGKNYNVYVAANNPKTKVDVADVAALKALTYSEVEEGIAVVNDATNNISWPWTDQFANTPSGFIYKQYVAEADAESVKVGGSLYGFTTEKEFMMDCVLKNWTPDPNTRDQVFDATMNRAAAKIVLNVDFDADFLKSLTHDKKVVEGTETWVEKSADKKVTITGTPAWRFYNFAFGAPVFAPEAQGAGIEVHSSETLLRHPYAYAGENKSFQIISYTYPNKWAAADYATAAPSIVLSIGYTENGTTTYNYYRVPLVKSDVTEIERNHIYVVNATIATRGSELHEDEDEIKDLHYYVLPWNDETNSAAIHNEVEAVQHKYLKVNPKIYTLRGDGSQSVDINYLKASGTSVGWKLFTYDTNGSQTAVVANDATGATRAWFYNSTGAFTTTYSDTGSGITWGNTMGVNITQSTEGVSGTFGKFTVTSQALTNKAIKYIRFRVFLNEDETLYEDVIIRHFPTDNIQNIYGSWSSRYNTNGTTTSVTLTTETLAEAQSWAEEYGVEIESETKTVSEYISYATYSAHAGEEGYAIDVATTTTNSNTFRTNVQNVAQRAAANGQDNAVLGEDGYSYWGVNPVYQGSASSTNFSGSYDYYSENTYYYGYYDYYNYEIIYRARYSHTRTYTEYSVIVNMASTGDWVDWNRDAGKTYSQANVKYTRGNNFTAKVYDESRSRIYAIEPTRSGTQGNRRYTYALLKDTKLEIIMCILLVVIGRQRVTWI